MPAKAPENLRWCKTCDEYRPTTEFSHYKDAYCHPHWLVWNRAKAARFRNQNPGYDAKRTQRWKEANPDRVREKNKAWAADQKAKGYPNLKKWIAENPEKAREMWRRNGKAWREANPEKAAAQRHRKRARKAKAPGHHTGEELILLREQFSGLCAYCENEADTWDHVIPLYRGGTNFIWNIAPACRSCNSSKQHKPPEECLVARDLRADAHQYIMKSIQRGRELTRPEKYIRNPYEKVSEQALWDAAMQVFQRNGVVTESGLSSTPFSVSTFRRRLGGLRKIQAVLEAK